MCALELPEIDTQIWQRYRNRDVVVLGLSGDGLFGQESRETVERFGAQSGVSFPLLLGDQSRRGYGKSQANISPYPFDVIIDREGKIRYMSSKFDGEAMRRVIDELLDGDGQG